MPLPCYSSSSLLFGNDDVLGALTRNVRSNRLLEIPDDADGGWRIKADIMRELAQGDISDLEMQERWQEATRGARFRDSASEIRAWLAYIQKHVRYTPASFTYDIGRNGQPVPRTQVIIRPAIVFHRGLGDCVAMATAAAAGLAIAGYDCDFVFVSTRPDKLPSHVYLHVWYPARTHESCTAFDATVQKPAGWEVSQNAISWKEIVPALLPWDGGSSQRSNVGGSDMIGRIIVDRNKNGNVTEVTVTRSPFTGRENLFSYAAWSEIPVPMLSIKRQNTSGGTLDVYAKTNRELPTVGGSDGPWTYDFPGTIAGESFGNEVNVLAHQAGQVEEAIAKIHLMLTLHDRMRLAEDQNIDGWLDDAWKTVETAAKSAGQAVTVAARQTSAAVTQGANQVYNSARQAGQTVSQATNQAVRSTQKAVKQATAQLQKIVNKIKPTPLQRVLLYLGAGPPGAVAAYKYLQKHQYEVVQGLPGWARTAVNNAEKNITNTFSTHGAVGGFPISFDGLTVGHSIGRAAWVTKIAEAWDHLPHKTKNLIIAALVIILIITIIICIYASPALQGWLKAAWEILVNAFKAFFGVMAKYWKEIMGFIVRLFKGSGGPALVVDPIPADPLATASDPTAADYSAMDSALLSVDEDPSKPEAATNAVYSFGAAAALGVAKAFAF